MLNLFIGLCANDPGLPNCVYRLGYRLTVVERGFSTATGDRVKPDAILSSDQCAHSLLGEWKSGSNIEHDQLRRYATVTADDLRQRAQVPASASLTHDVMLVGRDEVAERLCEGLHRVDVTFPLICETTDGLALRRGRFCNNELTSLFSPALEIDWDVAPVSYVPFDAESDLATIARFWMPRVVALLVRGERRVILGELIPQVISMWSYLSAEMQSDLRKRVREVMREAVDVEFASYLQRDKAAMREMRSDVWTITQTGVDLPPDRRTALLASLHRAQKSLIERLASPQQSLPFSEE
jgi:hypothetical protein